MQRRLISMVAALFGAATAFGQSSLFKIDLSTRSTSNPPDLADAVYNQFHRNLWNLSEFSRSERLARGLHKSEIPYLVPAIVRLVQNGSVLPTAGRTRGNGITLSIDSTFNTSSDATRVQFMQNVYTQGQALIEQYFGDAAISGTVNVVNANATIGDRNAITGGYYLPNNGSGGREIRMALNNSREVAAVSLIHCIMLAYLPDPAYQYDAYLEGLVRAATASVVRNGGFQTALGLDSDVIESILEQTYEIGPYYDWTNQKSLGGPQFIAPNLVSVPISQGTRGGLFFQRYQMAGSVWEKMLAQYPTFIKDLNLLLRSNSSAASDVNALNTLASGLIGAGTVEGDSYSVWASKQFILDTKLTVGTKLHSQITPITEGLSGTDFGVFNIEATLFSTDASGNETLLSGTSYPIYWDKSYNRVLASSQSETMDIAASYGSVVPNFPDNNGGIPYRVSVDLPIQDRVIRQYLPVGCIATPSTTTPSDFYGTVTGFSVPNGNSLIIRVHNGSDTNDVPVNNYAFGAVIGTANFKAARSLTLEVIRKDSLGSETILLTRVVNKGIGALAVQLGDAPTTLTGFNSGLSGGIQMVGFTGDPLASKLEPILNLSSNGFLAARYNPGRTLYDLYPNTGAVNGGQSYFVRVPASSTPTWRARVETGTAVAISLRPGWNMITCPLGLETSFGNVDVVHTTEFPRTYLGASGNDSGDTGTQLLAKDVFQFVPGANDAVTGVPEGGSFTAATSFSPGVGYFIRCLAPEGVTLLFKPTSANIFASKPPTVTHQLEVQIARQGESTKTYVGQAPGATVNFDQKMDSVLPPGIGGLQVAVQASELRYRDFKPVSPIVTTRVVANGLVVGKRYTFSFNTLNGRAQQIQVMDLQLNQGKSYSGSTGSFSFTASKTSMSFDVTVRGARS